MKIKELLCYVFLMGLLVFLIGEKKKEEPKINTLHELDNVAVPEEFRKAIGYDSLQMIFFMGKWQANFCYPNEYVLNKFKLDTINDNNNK